MRRLGLRIFLVVCLTLALTVLFANELLDHLVTSYKGEIERLLADSLGAQVTIERIKPQLDPYPELRATNLTIGQSALLPVALKISQIDFRPDLWALISGKLILRQIDLQVPKYHFVTEHGAIDLQDFRLKANLNLDQKSIDLHRLKIKSKLNGLPLELLSSTIHLETDNGTMLLDQGMLTIGTNTIRLSGSGGLTQRKFYLNASNFFLEPSSLRSLLDVVIPNLGWRKLGGSISGSITCSGSELDQINISGNLLVQKLDHGSKFSLGQGELHNLIMLVEHGQIKAAKMELNGSGLRIVDRTDRYNLTRASGVVELNGPDHKGTRSISANLDLNGFGFADGTTTLKDVSATLRSIKVGLSDKGGVMATVELNGTELKLEHESVQIQSVKKITAPLKISIPAEGGYSVSGPVTLTAADIATIGHRFEQVGATIKMLVSRADKSFSTEALQFVERGQPGKLTLNFQMVPTAYNLLSAQSDLFGGSVELNGQIERSAKKPIRLKLSGQNLLIQKIYSFIDPTSTEPVLGTIDFLTLALRAERPTLPDSIQGEGEVRITQPEARKTRLARGILDALRSVPVVGQIFGAKKLEESTDSQNFSAKLRFADSSCHLDHARLLRASYRVDASGKLGFDRQLDLRGDVILLEETASVLGLGVGPLKRLFGRAGRIVVPIFITGRVPDIKVSADLKSFIKNNSGIGLGQEILQGIGSVLSPNKRPNESPSK